MTPSARVAAAIDILDDILTGEPAEKALTTWARRSRFAGSKDRRAVRDHVFDVLRKRDAYQLSAAGSLNEMTGRSLMIGSLWHGEQDPADVFNGQGYAPRELTEPERARLSSVGPVANLPHWLLEMLIADQGESQAISQAVALSHRAPVTLRCNRAKIRRADLIERLDRDGFDCDINPLANDAITVRGAHRGLVQTQAFGDGLFEMQDASSQAVVESLPDLSGSRILDFCAGGGGKTLALAARYEVGVTAHDAEPRRMADLPERARRAGATVHVVEDAARLTGDSFDLVLVDAPCSGAGSWRRAPDAKWRFTPDRLSELITLQRQILERSQGLVASGGVLAYVTCSILSAENADQAAWFLATYPHWHTEFRQNWPVSEHGDGFFLTVFRKP